MKIKQLMWIYILNATVYFLQDWENLPGLSIFKYFKETLHYTPEHLMYISSILGLAWIPKIIWGYCCDTMFSKKVWIGFTLIIDLVTVLVLGLWSLPVVALLTLIFFNNTDSAIRDVAVDGIMCVEGKKYNETGKIQTIQWISITITSIITSLLGGYIAEHYDYRLGFLLIIPFYIWCVIPLLKYKENYRVVEVSNEKQSRLETLKSYGKIFKDKSFLWVCLFIFLYNYSPSFGTPISYIERDKFHWSFQFMGMLGALASIAGVLGYLIYGKICKKINIKKWLICSVFLGALTSLAYLYLTPASVIAYAILFSLFGAMIQITILDFMAKRSINGFEASTFALLCGITNLSSTTSTVSGAFLFPKIGLNNLIIVSAITSFLCLGIINKIFITNEN
jgi:predicted MFS family arabinose efflux permease